MMLADCVTLLEDCTRIGHVFASLSKSELSVGTNSVEFVAGSLRIEAKFARRKEWKKL